MKRRDFFLAAVAVAVDVAMLPGQEVQRAPRFTFEDLVRADAALRERRVEQFGPYLVPHAVAEQLEGGQ